jgi:hypothetical protein
MIRNQGQVNFSLRLLKSVPKMPLRETKRNKTGPEISLFTVDENHLLEVLCARPCSVFFCC